MFRFVLVLLLASPAWIVGADWPQHITMIQEYAQRSGLAWRTEGSGIFRIAWVGGTSLPGVKLVETGMRALDQLEKWTGRNAIFAPPPLPAAGKSQPARPEPPAEQIYWLVIMPSQPAVWQLIDDLIKQKLIAIDGRDFRKLDGISLPNAIVTNIKALSQVREQQAAYAAGRMAIQRFFGQRGVPCPAWLSEGIATELQRQLLGDIRCTTIAYELSDRTSNGPWPGQVARMLAGKEKGVKPPPAVEVLRCELAGCDMASYQQMWSLFCYLRDSAKAQPGRDNRLMRAIERIGSGANSETAVTETFGSADQRLTKAWYAWAAQQRN